MVKLSLLAVLLAACIDHSHDGPGCDHEPFRCTATISCDGSKSIVDIDVCTAPDGDLEKAAMDKAANLASTCGGMVVNVYCGDAE